VAPSSRKSSISLERQCPGSIDAQREKGMDDFKLDEEHFFVIMSAMAVLRKMLQRLTAIESRVGAIAQVVGVAHALYALERLPVATPGVYVELSINLSANEDDQRYWSIRIDALTIEVSSGGLIDLGAGHDHWTDFDFRIEVGGYRHVEGDFVTWETIALEALDMSDAVIEVTDESDCGVLNRH
jgi:hypothetical protein